MDTVNLVSHWRRLAEQKWRTTESLMRSRRYADALFFCHLALETRLKAAVVERTGKYPPLIHDLARLAHIAGLSMGAGRRRALDEITTFNVSARYDDEKFSFYKKATRNFATKHFTIATQLLLWIDGTV